MDSILVASDLSERSDRALGRALALAAAHGARLVVVCVIDEDLPDAMARAMTASAETQLREACRAAATPVEVRVLVGEPTRDIPAIAAETSADLLVLGPHRPRPLLDLFSGTTMERLVRCSDRPVLLAAARPERRYAKALVGLDLSPASAAAARAIPRLAPEAEIFAFYAYWAAFKGFSGAAASAATLRPYLEEAERELAAWRAGADLPNFAEPPVVAEGSVAQVFSAQLRAVEPDLVAIGAHGRSALAPTLLGSFTEELIRRPPCDLLVVRR